MFGSTPVFLGRDRRMRQGICRRIPLLSSSGIDDILLAVAKQRSAIQGQRENELKNSISGYAARNKWQAFRHLGHYVTLCGPGRSIRLDVALGVPTSAELERAWCIGAEHDTKRIVYDSIGLTNAMADHLAFLGKRLPIELLDVGNTSDWSVIP